MGYIIAMDGPAASGKGTISRGLAKELGFNNLDTGAIYRCICLEIIRKNINIDDIKAIVNLPDEICIKFEKQNEEEKVFLNGEDVTNKIRTVEINSIVSKVSGIKKLREKVNNIQRKMAEGKKVIMEGRDIGTCIFPNADVKIYLDAKVEERANRRYKENIEKGIHCTYEEVLESLKKRDHYDMNREVSPLRKADDAIRVDTTELTIEEVISEIKRMVLQKLGDKLC